MSEDTFSHVMTQMISLTYARKGSMNKLCDKVVKVNEIICSQVGRYKWSVKI